MLLLLLKALQHHLSCNIILVINNYKRRGLGGTIGSLYENHIYLHHYITVIYVE